MIGSTGSFGAPSPPPNLPPNHPGYPPLNQPHYGIGFGAAIRRGFAKYLVFDGRAARSEFWWWFLGNIATFVVLGGSTVAIGATTADASGTSRSPLLAIPLGLLGVWVLATVLPTIAITVRRLHDTGQSGLLYLLSLIPNVGSLIVLILCMLGSSPAGLRYDRLGPGQVPVLPPGV